MPIQQITAFLEDRARALLDLLELLAAADINIYALSMAETRDYGAVRLIVSDHSAALAALAAAKVPVREVAVLAAQLPDRPGALARVVSTLAERGIDIHYCYAFFTRGDSAAWVILRVADPEFAASVLQRDGVRILQEQDLAALGQVPA